MSLPKKKLLRSERIVNLLCLKGHLAVAEEDRVEHVARGVADRVELQQRLIYSCVVLM